MMLGSVPDPWVLVVIFAGAGAFSAVLGVGWVRRLAFERRRLLLSNQISRQLDRAAVGQLPEGER